MKGEHRYHLGDYNFCSQEWQADGTCIVTFHRNDEAHAVRLHMTDPDGPNEKVHSETAVPIGPAAHTLRRQAEAAKMRDDGG